MASQQLQCSSFLFMTYFLLKGYNILPKKELLMSLWLMPPLKGFWGGYKAGLELIIYLRTVGVTRSQRAQHGLIREATLNHVTDPYAV